jgi:hypothetical protein
MESSSNNGVVFVSGAITGYIVDDYLSSIDAVSSVYSRKSVDVVIEGVRVCPIEEKFLMIEKRELACRYYFNRGVKEWREGVKDMAVVEKLFETASSYVECKCSTSAVYNLYIICKSKGDTFNALRHLQTAAAKGHAKAVSIVAQTRDDAIITKMRSRGISSFAIRGVRKFRSNTK